ncbi:MAG: hypothetical protein AO394_09985 [Candidatus Fermentibacter daniensis]|nr:MAG: hypothetical protein AO394_09985 [Candidatus Fermentibacter daniensis]
MKLYHISLAGYSENMGAEHQFPYDDYIAPLLTSRGLTMNPSMELTTRYRQLVVEPELLVRVQGALSLTEHDVLQQREREQLVVRKPFGHIGCFDTYLIFSILIPMRWILDEFHQGHTHRNLG